MTAPEPVPRLEDGRVQLGLPSIHLVQIRDDSVVAGGLHVTRVGEQKYEHYGRADPGGQLASQGAADCHCAAPPWAASVWASLAGRIFPTEVLAPFHAVQASRMSLRSCSRVQSLCRKR